MTSTAGKTQADTQPSDRFLAPDTAPTDRIDQLALVEPGQAAWLKRALEIHWPAHLPQPFIGYDSEAGAFVAEWQSEAACNTLTIDAENHRGWYEPWPAREHADLPEELDLDTEEAWRLLSKALMTTRP